MFTNHILLSTFPLLMLMHSTSTRLPVPFPSSYSKLPRPLSPLATLVVPPKPGGFRKRKGCGNDGGRERRRARSVAHPSESHRLRYIDASRRASSVISRAKSATWQATCSNLSPLLILVLSSGFSMPSQAKRTSPKTLLFPITLPLLTLPTTMPLTFAHIYLKRHPVPRAEPNDSS